VGIHDEVGIDLEYKKILDAATLVFFCHSVLNEKKAYEQQRATEGANSGF
jgi:hypothetical protein